MFYSQFILAKKGPLGTIWIAAHLERKLRKNQVADTDIGVSVDSILFPEVPIALRLSSHLLLGVVRIYSKKVNYLFDDCSDALLKVKQAFRSAAVDLPPEQSKAPYHSITLPETFDLDDFELPDNEVFQGNFVDHHVSTREQITLQDTMDGVAFPTSQFGPDERFGDGDASQIGLDLDEELFMDKGNAAGTSGNLVGTEAEPQMSPRGTSPFKADEHNEGIPDPPLASSTNNYFVIQAPSTPGLTEEANLPSTKEEIQVSDDHMDEDQNPSALAAKEVSVTTSSPARPSNCSDFESLLNGNIHSMGEQDNGIVTTLKTESSEFISSGFVQPNTSNEHIDVTNGQDTTETMLNSSAPENDGTITADIPAKEYFEVKEVNMNGAVLPVAENTTVMEVEDVGFNKTDLNGNCHPLTDNVAKTEKPLAAPTIIDPEDAMTSGSEHQNLFHSSVKLNGDKISESSIVEKLSGFGTPFLQACTSKVPLACDGADDVLGTSTLPAQENGPSSIEMPGRKDATDVSEILTNVRDVVEPTTQVDQTANEADCLANSNLGGQQENLVAEVNYSEKENNLPSSDFPPTEVLLSMPNLPAGLSGNFPIDSTPSKEVLATNGDATGENIISGRKRSFTESTLTIQSLNSVESSGGAQSKGTVEFIPDDNDLLSSILAGKRSTSFKMKPSPAVPDTIHAKRQRTAVRSAPHKRKVLVDDSTVLHGDTIRQQLTNTEDIRRVRKKAPCTNLEVWVLQKQFLEVDIFNEPVFTEMFPSLSHEAFDLSGIQLIRDDGNKEASEADKAAKPALDEVTEGIGFLEPSAADISVRSMLDEKTEAVETRVASTAGDERLLECGIISTTPCEQESTMVGSSTPTKEIENVDSAVMNHMSQNDASKEKHGVEFDGVRTQDGDEAVSGPIPSVDRMPEVACYSIDNAKVDSLNKSNDDMMSMHIDDASDQLLDQRCDTHCSTGDASTVEDISVVRDVSKNFNLDEKSDGEHLLEKKEGVDTDVDMGNFQDTCSLPVHQDTSNSMALMDRTLDHVVEICEPDDFRITNKDETSFTGVEQYVSCLKSNNVDEHVKSDSPFSVEAYVSSQITKLNETEGLQHLEADPNIVMESTPLLSEFMDARNNSEFATDVIVHDTDFLNVDDDDVAEDYESDIPDHEENRILDNSGWSARTRAVANYLQALFEKESEQAKKVISLDSLLVGKSRKEASRMFFETLVLKTKDYVHAEQEGTFCDIKIKPRGKLMKPGF